MKQASIILNVSLGVCGRSRVDGVVHGLFAGLRWETYDNASEDVETPPLAIAFDLTRVTEVTRRQL